LHLNLSRHNLADEQLNEESHSGVYIQSGKKYRK
jgi:hypothetical protein